MFYCKRTNDDEEKSNQIIVLSKKIVSFFVAVFCIDLENSSSFRFDGKRESVNEANERQRATQCEILYGEHNVSLILER